jgi:hypothetical protein
MFPQGIPHKAGSIAEFTFDVTSSATRTGFLLLHKGFIFGPSICIVSLIKSPQASQDVARCISLETALAVYTLSPLTKVFLLLEVACTGKVESDDLLVEHGAMNSSAKLEMKYMIAALIA